MSYERWDVVLSLFPFSERPIARPRPVVVLSAASFNRDHDMIVTAMITTAAAGPLPTDHRLVDLAVAGLRQPCVVRWKIMTLATKVISRRIGLVGAADQIPMRRTLATLLPIGLSPSP